MAVALTNVAVADGYTAATSISGVTGGAGGSFDVSLNPVIYQLQWGPPAQQEWGPEGFARPGGGTISPGVTGIRFRNANPGKAAVVSAYVAGPGQPVLQVASTSSG
ncbi:MAG: hypothetical protein ACRD2H_13840 [Terriglobales bacterium]